MLRPLHPMLDKPVEATDGSVGRVTDMLLDDHRWTVRYIVVSPGGWLGVARALIAPAAVVDIGDRLVLNLTRDTVRRSPPLTAATVTREYEEEYARYYGVPGYWVGAGAWGEASVPGTLRPVPGAEPTAADLARTAAHQESRLTSVIATIGFHISASDGDIGHVDDFLADERSWEIQSLVVDTSNWIGGRSVLVPRRLVREVDRVDGRIAVAATREQVREGPELTPEQLLTAADRDQRPPSGRP